MQARSTRNKVFLLAVLLLTPALLTACGVEPLPLSYEEVDYLQSYDFKPALRSDAQQPREQWWQWRGHQIHLDVWMTDEAPRGTVLLIHGGGGHGRLLSTYARSLATSGYTVIAPDLPLYGLSIISDSSRITAQDWVDCVVDLANEFGDQGTPTVAFGLSLGGTVALFAATGTDAIDAVAATTLLDIRDLDTLRFVSTMPWAVDLLLSLKHLVGSLEVPAIMLAPLSKMSSDPDLVKALAEDPLIGRRRIPLSFFASLKDARPGTPLTQFNKPLLLMHPTNDIWTPLDLSEKTLAQLGTNVELVMLENGSHFPLEAPAREQLDAALLSFLSRLGP